VDAVAVDSGADLDDGAVGDVRDEALLGTLTAMIGRLAGPEREDRRDFSEAGG
jgi:hypothetical protein